MVKVSTISDSQFLTFYILEARFIISQESLHIKQRTDNTRYDLSNVDQCDMTPWPTASIRNLEFRKYFRFLPSLRRRELLKVNLISITYTPT